MRNVGGSGFNSSGWRNVCGCFERRDVYVSVLVWKSCECWDKKKANQRESKYLRNDSLQESETRGRDSERLTETPRFPPAVTQKDRNEEHADVKTGWGSRDNAWALKTLQKTPQYNRKNILQFQENAQDCDKKKTILQQLNSIQTKSCTKSYTKSVQHDCKMMYTMLSKILQHCKKQAKKIYSQH